MKPDGPNVDTPPVRDGNPDRSIINFSRTIRSRLYYFLAGALGLSILAYLDDRLDVQRCEDAIGKSRSEIESREQEVMKHLEKVPGSLDVIGLQNMSHLEVRYPPPSEAECAQLRQKLLATKRGTERRLIRHCSMGSAVEDLDDTYNSMIELENDLKRACPGTSSLQ